MTEAQAAYFAGLIDGEGYVGIVKRAPKKNRCVTPKYTARLSIAMTDREPLDELVRVFGLRSAFLKTRKRDRRWAECFVVDIENNDAVRVLLVVRPFLLVKRRQADLACQLRALQTRARRDRMEPHATHLFAAGRNAGRAYTVLRLSAAYIGRCEGLYAEVKALNERGAKWFT